MQGLQPIFNRIQENKEKLKSLKGAYRDALATSPSYQETQEELKKIRLQKKNIEQATRDTFASEFSQMDDLKIDIGSDEELLSDIAMTKLMKGETVEVVDTNQQPYEPIFTVRFKKTR